MNQLKILSPDNLKAKARAKVRAFQAAKRLEEARANAKSNLDSFRAAKRAEGAGVNISKLPESDACSKKRFWISVGEFVKLDSENSLVLVGIKGRKASFVVDSNGGGPRKKYPGQQAGTAFQHGNISVFIVTIEAKRAEVAVTLQGHDCADVEGKASTKRQKELDSKLLEEIRRGSRRIDKILHLLEEGANPDSKYPNGLTALMDAVAVGSLHIVNILVDAGADVNCKQGGSADGWTALDYATKNSGRIKIANFLKNKGAKRGDELP